MAPPAKTLHPAIRPQTVALFSNSSAVVDGVERLCISWRGDDVVKQSNGVSAKLEMPSSR